jgi:hypothetical protein
MRIFTRERQLRLQAEKRRDEIQSKLLDYQQKMKEIHETLVCYLIIFHKVFFSYYSSLNIKKQLNY